MNNDRIFSRVISVDSEGWESMNPIYPEDITFITITAPGYVTDTLSFGNDYVDFTHIWVDKERETVFDKNVPRENPLTAFNLKTNDEGDLTGIQLVYAQSGESPFFEVIPPNGRKLDETELDSTEV